MRSSTLIFSFLGILLLTGASKIKQTQKLTDQKETSISPWGEPLPPHKEEMLQKQEEEDRYDVDDSTNDEDEEDIDEVESNGEQK
jgi:hypothetical protein